MSSISTQGPKRRSQKELLWFLQAEGQTGEKKRVCKHQKTRQQSSSLTYKPEEDRVASQAESEEQRLSNLTCQNNVKKSVRHAVNISSEVSLKSPPACGSKVRMTSEFCLLVCID